MPDWQNRMRFLKINHAVFLFLFVTAQLLSTPNQNLKQLLDSMLEKHPDYQQALSRYEQEKGLYRIEKSLNSFDLNFHYQQYDNDFTRDETVNSLEHSDVNEKDKRWHIELEKEFFPKDFDATKDIISSRINLMRYGQDLRFSYFSAVSDIFDDMSKWYEARMMTIHLQERLSILYKQNSVLEDLHRQKQIGPDLLINNLEDIGDTEKKLNDYKEKQILYADKYGDILPEFLAAFEDYKVQAGPPDTLSFEQNVENEINGLTKEAGKISRQIKFSYLHFYLPEVNLKLSYNWRETDQDWDVTQNSIFKNRIVKQKEEFPQGEIELSLPFNMFYNASGKFNLLKAYGRELKYRSSELQVAWQKFSLDRMNGYNAARNDFLRKTRLNELYHEKLTLQMSKYNEEPSLLGSNPALELQQITMKADKAEADMKIAEMKFYKEIFLINYLGEETK
jgi:hypothetical protein